MIPAALLAALAGWFVCSAPRSTSTGVEDSMSATFGRLLSWRPGTRRRVVVDRSTWVTRFAAALAAELRSGQQPDVAWTRLWATGPPHCPDLAPQVASGTSVVQVMQVASRTPGCRGLQRIAACWAVTEVTGAGLAQALERIGRSLVAEQDIAVEIDGQLAGPRATAKLLVLLPAFALFLGNSLGADPLSVLFHSVPGLACLTVGVLLLLLGWRWSHAQVRSVTVWSE